MKENKVLCFLMLLFLALSCSVQARTVVPMGKNGETATVSRVLDGDTMKLSNGQTLKLAGINAPELHDTPKLPEEAKRFGKEVWAYRTLGAEAHKIAQHLIELGENQIRLESDSEAFDENGNLLAYVFVSVKQLEGRAAPDSEVSFEKEGRYEIFLNAYLIKLGLAEVTGDSSEKYKDLFLKLEQEAKDAKMELWGT